MARGGLVVGLLLAAPLGCDAEVLFSDSIDETIDFRDAGDDGPGLHDPYAVGATFELRANAPFGATLVSSNDDVLALDGDGTVAQAEAVGPGRAEISLVDDGGGVIASVDIEVRMPTRVVLHAAGAVLLDRADVPTEAMAPRIIEGGTALFMVQAFDGATRLAGTPALEPLASDGLAVTMLPELLGERRAWLQVDALAPGEHDVTFVHGSDVSIRVDVDVVAADTIADVDVFGSDGGGRGVVVATAYDLDGEPLYGVDFDWSLAGGATLVAADLVRPGSAAPVMLAARYGELAGAVETGDDESAKGCSVGAPGGLGGAAWLLLVVAGLRRRRVR